jgi:hypothetical protein
VGIPLGEMEAAIQIIAFAQASNATISSPHRSAITSALGSRSGSCSKISCRQLECRGRQPTRHHQRARDGSWSRPNYSSKCYALAPSTHAGMPMSGRSTKPRTAVDSARSSAPIFRTRNSMARSIASTERTRDHPRKIDWELSPSVATRRLLGSWGALNSRGESSKPLPTEYSIVRGMV